MGEPTERPWKYLVSVSPENVVRFHQIRQHMQDETQTRISYNGVFNRLIRLYPLPTDPGSQTIDMPAESAA